MKTVIILSLMVVLISCGKTEKKTKSESLQLSGIQNSGLNLASANYGRYIVVTCDDNGSSNAQRLSELQNFRNRYRSTENFTIMGATASPTQMMSLIDQAIANLTYYRNYPYCPDKIIAEIAI